jgi:hypothetical protein
MDVAYGSGILWFVLGLVVLIIGDLLGPALKPEPRPLVSVVLLLVGLVVMLLGLFALLGVG